MKRACQLAPYHPKTPYHPTNTYRTPQRGSGCQRFSSEEKAGSCENPGLAMCKGGAHSAPDADAGGSRASSEPWNVAPEGRPHHTI